MEETEGKELKKKKLPLSVWVKMVEEYKKESVDSGLRKFEYEFIRIDVNETAAYVKLKLMSDESLVFKDLLAILRFKDEWKEVTKVYHTHIENPWKL